MIHILRIPVAALLAAAFLAPSAAAQGGNGQLMTYLASLPYEAVSAAEQADLIAMREEEKLARDVYQTLGQVWGTPIFSNIASAEQQHMNLVGLMLQKYSIPDPITSSAVGVFQNPVLGQLYAFLVSVGMTSQPHALLVGALIEDLDMFDLGAAITRTDNRDIGAVLQNLTRGSRNHMRAFYGQLSGTYLYPGFWLSYAQVQAVVTTPMENGAVDENGVPL
jgi:hypothetical protein